MNASKVPKLCRQLSIQMISAEISVQVKQSEQINKKKQNVKPHKVVTSGMETYNMRRCSRSPRVNGIEPEKLLPDRSLKIKRIMVSWCKYELNK